jgi:hypothetical protein
VNAAIDQAYAVHAGLTITLRQDYKDGLITKDQKDAYASRTASALFYIDEADSLFNKGDLDGASLKVSIANEIFRQVRLEAAKQAAKEQK